MKKALLFLCLPLWLGAQQNFDVQTLTLEINNLQFHINNQGSLLKDGQYPNEPGPALTLISDENAQGLLKQGGLTILAKSSGRYFAASSLNPASFQPGAILNSGEAVDPSDPFYAMRTFDPGDVILQDLIDLGCPGEVWGNQMFFSVFNDLTDFTPNQWEGITGCGMEVAQHCFAYEGEPNLDNTIFLKYRFAYKGSETLDSVYVSFYFDADLLSANDDLAGTDTSRNMIFTYNADHTDPVTADKVPALAVSLLHSDLPLTATHFSAANAAAQGMYSGLGNVDTAWQIRRGEVEYSSPWAEDGGFNPFPFSGDAALQSGWLMKDAMAGGNVTMQLITGPVSLSPGDVRHFTLALMGVTGAETHLLTLEAMQQQADEIQQFHDDNLLETAVAEIAAGPESLTLHAAYPNPFNPATTLRFDLPKTGEASLAIYDIRGRRIETLAAGALHAGRHSVSWNAAHLPSGLYIARLTQGHQTATAKLLLQK